MEFSVAVYHSWQFSQTLWMDVRPQLAFCERRPKQEKVDYESEFPVGSSNDFQDVISWLCKCHITVVLLH